MKYLASFLLTFSVTFLFAQSPVKAPAKNHIGFSPGDINTDNQMFCLLYARRLSTNYWLGLEGGIRNNVKTGYRTRAFVARDILPWLVVKTYVEKIEHNQTKTMTLNRPGYRQVTDLTKTIKHRRLGAYLGFKPLRGDVNIELDFGAFVDKPSVEYNDVYFQSDIKEFKFSGIDINKKFVFGFSSNFIMSVAF